MKKKRLVVSLSVVLIAVLTFGSPSVSFAAQEFTDVKEGSSHYEGIQWLSKQGITGYDDGSFGKYVHLSREHAAIMFAKALKLKLPNKTEVTKYFNDVDENDEYADYIAAVAQKGIFKGDNRQFGAKQALTREQMASTLVNAYQLESGTASADVNLSNVGPSHKGSVQTIADLGITKALQDFRPKEIITRGQFATFLYGSSNVEIGEVPTPEPEKGMEKNYINQSYNYTFTSALNKQMALSTLPQTDGPGGWYDASRSMAAYYMNPKNFQKNSSEYYQFLSLSGSSNVSTDQLNSKVLKNKGILDGRAAEFKQASKLHNINEVYLIAHALLETGNGSSALATGVEVGQSKAGNPVRVTNANRKKLKNIKTTYNFFGIGAVDSAALSGGSQRAYAEGWFTPEKAIVGGAKFVSEKYIAVGQDTIYKMRWNPDRPASHQYATDAGWAVKQTSNIEKTYDLLQDATGAVMNFEVPNYKNQPAAKARPTGVHRYYMNTNHAYAGQTGVVSGASSLNVRTGPSAKFNQMTALPRGAAVQIIGVNKNKYPWYKIKTDGKYGWVSGAYISVGGAKSIQSFDLNLGDHSLTEAEEAQEEASQANVNRIIGAFVRDDVTVYQEADADSEPLMEALAAATRVEVLAEKTNWSKILIDGKEGWVQTEDYKVINMRTVKADTKVFATPNGEEVDELLENDSVIIVPTKDLEFTQDGDWYQVYSAGVKVWVHQDQLN